MARHPELIVRTTESIDRGRVVKANKENIGQYVDVRAHKLQDKPHLILNCDDSAFVLSKSVKKVLVPRGRKHCQHIDHSQYPACMGSMLLPTVKIDEFVAVVCSAFNSINGKMDSVES